MNLEHLNLFITQREYRFISVHKDLECGKLPLRKRCYDFTLFNDPIMNLIIKHEWLFINVPCSVCRHEPTGWFKKDVFFFPQCVQENIEVSWKVNCEFPPIWFITLFFSCEFGCTGISIITQDISDCECLCIYYGWRYSIKRRRWTIHYNIRNFD